MLLMSWCQISEKSFRGLVESKPRRVRDVLVEQVGPAVAVLLQCDLHLSITTLDDFLVK